MLRIVKCSLIATAVVGMKVNRRRLGSDNKGDLAKELEGQADDVKNNDLLKKCAEKCDAFAKVKADTDKAKVKTGAKECDTACKAAEADATAKAKMLPKAKTACEEAKKAAGAAGKEEKEPSCCGGKAKEKAAAGGGS